MRRRRATLQRAKRAFSLVELVIVIVIISILAAMAVPRLSRGSGDADEAALAANLYTVRTAILRYSIEHNGRYPGAEGGDVAAQLTQYSDRNGAVSATRSSTYKYGPYLVAIPPCPIGDHDNPTGIRIDTTNSPPKPVPSDGNGWVYNPNTGEFCANSRDAAVIDGDAVVSGDPIDTGDVIIP